MLTKNCSIILLGVLTVCGVHDCTAQSNPMMSQVSVQKSTEPTSLLGAITSLTTSTADEKPTFTISVRAVYAEGMLGEGETRLPDAEAFEPKLKDIQAKLEKLPFKTFKLVAEDDHEVSLRQKDSMRLSNGQRLCLRAVDADAERVTLWFRWSDSDGNSLLDTRMNFSRNETMVAGVESAEENSGVVLAVKVS